MYAENSQRIRYFSEISEIAVLANVVYLITLKHKVVGRVYYQMTSATLEVAVCEIKAYKAKVMSEHRETTEDSDKISLS
jgi:hypothetical protein